MEKENVTTGQYEQAKNDIVSEYLQKKQSIADEFNARLAEVEEGYRKAKKQYCEEGNQLYNDSIEAKNRFESDLTKLKVWLLEEEQKAEQRTGDIDELRLRYRKMKLELFIKKHRRLDANDRLKTMSKIAYAKAVQNWLINIRDLSVTREKCEIEAYRFMLKKMSELPKPETEEGVAE